MSSADADSNEALSEEFLEVANGCLCCSVKDNGAAAIEKLMKKRGRFDYILLETTGLADPGPIASIFLQNEDLSEDIMLDGVVSVVDGVFGLEVSLLSLACCRCVLIARVIANSKRYGDRRSQREPQVRPYQSSMGAFDEHLVVQANWSRGYRPCQQNRPR